MDSTQQFPEVTKARQAFVSGKTMPIDFRRKQLQNLLKFFDDKESRQKICEASFKDLRKTTEEAILSEIVTVKVEITTILANLEDYLKPERLPRRLHSIQDTASIQLDPHGVVLVLGTWNYPFYMTLFPVVGAIAAGNCVLIKPSEISQHSAQVMAEILPQYLDSECYHVIQGDVEVTKSLLEQPFDYIFFTGSQNVGKCILKAAANNFTPVTLELGGKSPVYIDDSACCKRTVKRILWGKCINLGQSCLAPDYIICSKKTQENFIALVKEVFKEWYRDGKNLQKLDDFARIINTNHFQRLKNLLDKTKGDILLGGNTDEKDLWIEPTFVGNIKREDILMDDEIFGPILPIVTVNSADEAISFINSTERPLALYVFSKNDETTQKIINSTSSGGVCVNDIMVHSIDLRLPFGGKGKSGMGQYHGKYSIETFSHKRAIHRRELSYFSEKVLEIRYPPYTSRKVKAQEMILMWVDSLDITLKPLASHVLMLLAGFFVHTMFTRHMV